MSPQVCGRFFGLRSGPPRESYPRNCSRNYPTKDSRPASDSPMSYPLRETVQPNPKTQAMPREIVNYRKRSDWFDGFYVTLWEESASEPFKLRCALSGREAGEHACYDEDENALLWERIVPRTRLTGFFQRLQSLSLPALPKSVWGLDGTTHEFTVHLGFHKLRLTWWSDLPEEWRAVGPLVATLERLADVATVFPLKRRKPKCKNRQPAKNRGKKPSQRHG